MLRNQDKSKPKIQMVNLLYSRSCPNFGECEFSCVETSTIAGEIQNARLRGQVIEDLVHPIARGLVYCYAGRPLWRRASEVLKD